MIDRKTVFDIHQLKDAGYSARLIAREMRLGRDTVSKYLKNPDGALQARKPRASDSGSMLNHVFAGLR
jgi:transposase